MLGVSSNDSVNDVVERMRVLYAEEDQLDIAGKLVVGRVMRPGFYRLLDGRHSNRVFYYGLCGGVDGKPTLHFVNVASGGGAWIWKDEIKDDRCESVVPSFPAPRHESVKNVWYGDGGGEPLFDKW